MVAAELLGDHRVDDVVFDVGHDLVAGDAAAVLGRDHHSVEPHRAQALIDDGGLALAVGTQIRDLSRHSDLVEASGQAVRDTDRQRHQLGRLITRETEHHPLVARDLAPLAGVEAHARGGGHDYTSPFGVLGTHRVVIMSITNPQCLTPHSRTLHHPALHKSAQALRVDAGTVSEDRDAHPIQDQAFKAVVERQANGITGCRVHLRVQLGSRFKRETL